MNAKQKQKGKGKEYQHPTRTITIIRYPWEEWLGIPVGEIRELIRGKDFSPDASVSVFAQSMRNWANRPEHRLKLRIRLFPDRIIYQVVGPLPKSRKRDRSNKGKEVKG